MMAGRLLCLGMYHACIEKGVVEGLDHLQVEEFPWKLRGLETTLLPCEREREYIMYFRQHLIS